MRTIKILFVVIFIIFYFSINYLSSFLEYILDKKLDNGNSIRALAKDITSNASCDLDVLGSLIEAVNEDDIHFFFCTHNRKNVHFLIHIFTTQTEKHTFLEKDNKRKIYFQKKFHSYYNPKHDKSLTRGMPEFYNPCFKQGKYFVVCEDARWDKSGIPQFTGAPYYHEFKGEDIAWKIPNS